MIALYESAFGDSPSKKTAGQAQLPNRDALDELADYLAHTKINGFNATMKLKGAVAERVYDVYRWSSPSRKHDEARAIRASLLFSHPTKLGNFLQFTIHYKPYELDEDDKKNHSTTRGVAIPIGDHVFLVGHESKTDYPLVIWISVDPDNPQEFQGLVMRRADNKNDLFASRFICRENTDASGLADVSDKLGIIPLGDLTDDELTLLEKVVNLVDNNGRQALSYFPFISKQKD